MSRLLAGLWTCGLAISLMGCRCGADEPGGPTSVLLLTLDTTRRDHLGFYGSQQGLSPNLDAIAAEGVVFEDARTEAPITAPAHASIHTGLGIREHGVRENGTFVLGERFVTLAEILAGKAYETAAFVSSFVLDERFGLSQGFEIYDDEMVDVSRGRWMGHDAPRFERQGHLTSARALGWLKERQTTESGRPFFLWVHYYDPHAAYRAPAEFEMPGRSSYATEVAFMDDEVGRVVREARRTAEDLLVVVVSDHGESLGEHGIHGHGSDVYESTMRAALLMQHRSLPKGVRVSSRTRIAAVAPSILEVLEIETNEIGGRSVVQLVREREATPAPLYMETLVPTIRSQRSGVHGLLEGPWKLIWWPKDERRELYHLGRDEYEERDLASMESPRADGMQARLASMIPRIGGLEQARIDVDPAVKQALRALGYLAADDATVVEAGEAPADSLGDAQGSN